jgi:hypothetical protein
LTSGSVRGALSGSTDWVKQGEEGQFWRLDASSHAHSYVSQHSVAWLRSLRRDSVVLAHATA